MCTHLDFTHFVHRAAVIIAFVYVHPLCFCPSVVMPMMTYYILRMCNSCCMCILYLQNDRREGHYDDIVAVDSAHYDILAMSASLRVLLIIFQHLD